MYRFFRIEKRKIDVRKYITEYVLNFADHKDEKS